MATIEKLLNGKYRIRKMRNGKRYSLVVDYKPGKKEAEELINSIIKDKPVCSTRSTFTEAVDDYCLIKSNVLSPSTIRNYHSVQRNVPYWFSAECLSNIDNRLIQRCINEYAIEHSPKSVSNLYGLISVIMKQYCDFAPSCTLPKKMKNDPYIPTKDDVKKLLDALDGTDWYVPTMLCVYGLRRSEVFALTLDDLDGNILTINKAMVKDENSNFIVKNTTKTSASTRKIYIDDDLVRRIHEQGFVTRGTPDNLGNHIVRTESRLGLPHFSVHKLRHYFASQMASVLPEADWLALGGWESSGQIAKTVYRHNQIMRDKEMQIKASNALIDTIK